MDRLDELREKEDTYLNKLYDIEESKYDPEEDSLQLLPNLVTGSLAGVVGTLTVCHFTTDFSSIALVSLPIASACVGFFAPQAARKIKYGYYSHKLDNNREEQENINLSRTR